MKVYSYWEMGGMDGPVLAFEEMCDFGQNMYPSDPCILFYKNKRVGSKSKQL